MKRNSKHDKIMRLNLSVPEDVYIELIKLKKATGKSRSKIISDMLKASQLLGKSIFRITNE